MGLGVAYTAGGDRFEVLEDCVLQKNMLHLSLLLGAVLLAVTSTQYGCVLPLPFQGSGSGGHTRLESTVAPDPHREPI